MEITPEIIAEWRVKKEVALRKRFDFDKMSIEQMQAITPPGELQTRSIWYEILQAKKDRQQEIDDYEINEETFKKMLTLPATEQMQFFKRTENGAFELKTNSELRDENILTEVTIGL